MLLLLAALMHQDSTVLTRVHLVVDSAVYADIKASEFLPRAFGSGSGDVPELTFCERLACLVFSQPDAASNRRAGDVILGVRVSRSGVAPAESTDSLANRARLIVAEPPPPPLGTADPDSLPLIYFLSEATLALPAGAIPLIAGQLRQAGAVVLIEGEGVVIQFPNVVMRLVPAWGSAAVDRLTFVLRRPMPGNPTYQFASRARLRFGPDRRAVWTF